MGNLVHYIVVRRDLPLGALLAQTAHAAGESFYLLGGGERRLALGGGSRPGEVGPQPAHPATCPGSSVERAVSNGEVAGANPASGSTTYHSGTNQSHTCVGAYDGKPHRRCEACESDTIVGLLKERARDVGFTACWRDRLTAPGTVCRMPRGHEGDCIPMLTDLPLNTWPPADTYSTDAHRREDENAWAALRHDKEMLDAPKPTVVVLGARNEQRLLRLEAQLRLAGVAHAAVREPDVPWCGQLMAVGLVPGEKAELAEHVREFNMIRGAWHPQSGVES